MDYSGTNELFQNTENTLYYRKTPVSRSIKQNGQLLFAKQRRRSPINHYIPPHRRKDFIPRSEAKDRASVHVFDKKNSLEFTENNFRQEFKEKCVITQEISVITQQTNEEMFTQQFNKENSREKFNQSYVNEKSGTRENTNHAFNQEDFRQQFNQERCIPDFSPNHTQKTNKENISHKMNQVSRVEKVLKLSNDYMNLEFKTILGDLYFDKYKEKLPTKCLNAIKFCIQLDLDDNINDFLNAGFHNEQNNQETRVLKDKEDYKSENILLCQKEIRLLKPNVLDLAKELKNIGKQFWVYIYKCDSFNNISGVILDANHFGMVEELTEQMKSYFQFEKNTKAKVEENSYYAVFDGSWHRVQCIKCNESTAEVFFIDRGDKDNISIDRLFKLDPKFFKLPAQAINMSLADLEVFADCDGPHEMLDELLFEKTLYVIVKNFNEEKNTCLSVQLYKTEDNQNINVNDSLMKKLFETILNPLHYIQEDKLEHVKFIQTNETGLFIQLHTISLKYFKMLMQDLIEKHCYDENLKGQKIVRFESNKIYLVKRSRDNKFYRARVLKFKTENTIEVLLIDNGIITYINREDFFALEKLSAVLAQYPAQAIEIELEQITVLHRKILDHLHALTSNSNELYVKFIKIELENNNIPIVQLFKKVNGYLVSVNDAILIEYNDILESKRKISESNSKSYENNFDESKLKSAEGNFGECKQKSVKGNLGKSKSKLAESSCDRNERKLTEGNLGENKPKSFEDNIDASETKSVQGVLDGSIPKLAKENLTNKQESAEKSSDESFKNIDTPLERLKQYESVLLRSSEEVDCSKLRLSGLLNAPEVPKGTYFDVHVVLAKNPSCFVIQLLKNRSVELKKMVQEMSIAYKEYRGPKFTSISLGVGQMYACRCESDSQMWYRVYVLKIKDKNIAAVYYCDYGWYKDVNIENLTCLQRQFYSLPYQAICAQLYGVKPLSGQFWTADASSQFKELVESRNLVCRVKSIKDVKAMKRSQALPLTIETIYVVKLIDTSTDEDLYIADMLIDDGQASRKSSNSNLIKNM